MTRRGAGLACAAALLGAGLVLAGCSDLDVSDPGPLSISLTATPGTAVMGAPIAFRFQASGDQLSAMVLFYGDGAVDSIATLGARTADGNRSHSYASPGTYLARITVQDVTQGQAQDTVTVQITPAGPERR